MDVVREIEERLPSDWKFLEKIYDLLLDGNVFNVDPDNKVVQFVEPEKLKDIIDFSLYENKALNEESIISICRKVIKYSVKTNHPRFRNQLFGQLDPFGLAGAWISEALNTSSYTYEVGPVFSLMETEIIGKLSKMCGYVEGDGIFSPGGSISNMYGMVLARYKLMPEIKTKGLSGLPAFVLFTSEESHYSFKKGANWLGIGTDNCVVVKTNRMGQMMATDLDFKILQAKMQGKVPFFVNATAGSTVLGAFDNLDEIADVCQKHKLWLHVDACHGGAVLISPKNRTLLKGIDRSDSISWNPHKAIGAPLQCALFLTKEKELLSECNGTAASYLFQHDKFYNVAYDTGNKSIQCGRKIDSFKLWLMFKARSLLHYGALIDHAIEIAKLFGEKVKERKGFLLVQDEFQYTNVCFWYIPKVFRNKPKTEEWYRKMNGVAPKIKEGMVKGGSMMVGYSPLVYRNIGNFLRMVFTCFPVTHEDELDFLLDEIERLGETAFGYDKMDFTNV